MERLVTYIRSLVTKCFTVSCCISVVIFGIVISSRPLYIHYVRTESHPTPGFLHYKFSPSFKGNYNLSPEDITRGKTYIWPWFSLRSFWRRNIPSTVEFTCSSDTIIFKNAYLDVNRIQGAPVVIFAGGFRGTQLWDELRTNRDPSQLWVFTTDESALTTSEYIPPLKYIEELQFNITFTYHNKSELSVPYGYYELFPANDTRRSDEDVDYHKLKPKFAAFMSSHCGSIAWSRSKFAEDLAEHIPLDRYGGCGNLTTCKRDDPKCTEFLKGYKFILGLENSCCEEYISEKFWHPLAVLESIPVVLGGFKEDYERIGPPNSFIHIGDFNSMEELATYLEKVAGDPVLYNSYFKWKKDGFVRKISGSDRRIRFGGAICRLHEYMRSRAWETIDHRFDVYGKHWLGGCRGCSSKKWITEKYGKAVGRFTHN